MRVDTDVRGHRRRWIDIDGHVIRDAPELLPCSSWGAVYRSLCGMLPAGAIHYGHTVTSVAEDADSVDIHFDENTAGSSGPADRGRRHRFTASLDAVPPATPLGTRVTSRGEVS